jgi:hypothetical protein
MTIDVDTDSNLLMVFIKFSTIFIIGLCLLSAIDVSSVRGVGSGVLTFTDNPSDGDTITLDQRTYEFDIGDGVQSGNIAVIIESTLAGTTANFKNVAGVNYEMV